MSDLDTVAAHYGLPADAVLHLAEALRRGHGRQAQFSHPALGGMGQWSAGGMTMIGAMSDTVLKAKVACLCADLAPLVGEPEGHHAGTQGDLDGNAWWPEGLGQPSSSGGQNGARYAVFPEARRLAIQEDGRVTLYDTGGLRIGGVSQQQGTGRDLSFSSQLGPVHLGDLKVVGEA